MEVKQKVGERCKRCGGVIGENIDGKPICSCEVWPGKDNTEPFTPMVFKPENEGKQWQK